MNTRKFSEALGNVGDSYIKRAADYNVKRQKGKSWVKWAVAAACLALVFVIIGSFVPFGSDMGVAVYAFGTNEEITSAGAVISTGTISDTGEMKGHPLMFYLSGKDIATVRFSCKNEQICFMDWTEQRDEYGNAQNFTVAYGKDESEYYYLTIDWIPNSVIRELTDNQESSIATLPEEMREDIIVLEITFGNGKTATKAIQVSLLDDGTFFAVFRDYEITDADTFVKRPDSQTIAREILYSQGDVSADGTENGEKERLIAQLKDAPCLDGNDALTNLTEHDMEDNTAQNGKTDPDNPPINWGAPDEAVTALKNYYAGTVFEVVSTEVKSKTEDEIIFNVCVSRGGVIQEPDRNCTLQYSDGAWKVTNEGY